MRDRASPCRPTTALMKWLIHQPRFTVRSTAYGHSISSGILTISAVPLPARLSISMWPSSAERLDAVRRPMSPEPWRSRLPQFRRLESRAQVPLSASTLMFTSCLGFAAALICFRGAQSSLSREHVGQKRDGQEDHASAISGTIFREQIHQKRLRDDEGRGHDDAQSERRGGRAQYLTASVHEWVAGLLPHRKCGLQSRLAWTTTSQAASYRADSQSRLPGGVLVGAAAVTAEAMSSSPWSPAMAQASAAAAHSSAGVPLRAGWRRSRRVRRPSPHVAGSRYELGVEHRGALGDHV